MTSKAEADRTRRILTVVHAAFLGTVPLCAAILWLLRGVPERAVAPTSSPRLAIAVPLLALLSIAEFFAIGVYAHNLLDAAPRPSRPVRSPLQRVQASFTLRFAAAEAIAIYGLILGFLGCAAWQAAAFFAGAIGGLLSAAPTKARFFLDLAIADPDLAGC